MSVAVSPSMGLQPIGGLRGRAIDVAMRLIEIQGPEDVNVREIAAELETGPASLYYHFASKDALLAELGAAGFRLLEATLSCALKNGRGDNPLRACGDGYLHFLRDHPMLYQVMYNERLLSQHSVARLAEQRAFAAFAKALNAVSGRDALGTDAAMALWALGRGIGALTMAAGQPADPPARELAHQIVRGLEALMGRPVRQPEPIDSSSVVYLDA
jgi:AcrR family transcriptional regulator